MAVKGQKFGVRETVRQNAHWAETIALGTEKKPGQKRTGEKKRCRRRKKRVGSSNFQGSPEAVPPQW